LGRIRRRKENTFSSHRNHRKTQTLETLQKIKNKMKIICKPEQSGKTFEMLNMIAQYKAEVEESKSNPFNPSRVMNIFFCANSLLLNTQTQARFEQKFKDEKSVQFSSKSKVKTFPVLWFQVTNLKIDNIVCCTNSTRVESIAKLIKDIKHDFPDIVINVWVDEVHTFFKQTLMLSALAFEGLNIYGLTATPKDKMFKAHSGSLEFYPLESVTNPEIYRCWEDLQKQGMQQYDFNTTNTHGFVEHVLNDNAELIIDNTNWFIPSDSYLEDHYAMRDMLLKHGFAVIVINGSGILLTMPGSKRCQTFSKDEEFATKLTSIYKEWNLGDYCVAITGNLCIGQAITIQSEDFLFDYAILSPSGDQERDSQSAGRVKGNIKGFENYKPCKVFTTKEFDETARRVEARVYALNKMACEKKENGEAPIITLKEFKDIKTRLNLDTDRDYACKFIPIIYQLTSENYSMLRLGNGRFDKKFIARILGQAYDWFDEFSWGESEQWKGIQQTTEPDTADSYKKHITDLVDKTERKMRAVMDRGPKSKEVKHRKQMWIYIDKEKERLIITRWDGTKL